MAKTYGVVVDYITGGYQVPMLRALKEKGREQGINLLCFEGRIFQASNAAERQHNLIYKLIEYSQLDGLIIFSSSVFRHYPADKGIQEILPHIDLPIVSLNQEIPGIPSVMIDNHSGMREAVKHLVEFHGRKKIAFVSGPINNVEANKRLAAYMSTLKENNLKINSDHIIPGNFHPEDGAEAMKRIMKMGEIDTIVFANDDMAIGAHAYLLENAPDKIDTFAMTGFDNIPGTAQISRPLTSVAQPFKEMAESAFRLLDNQISHQSCDPVIRCKTYLDIKQSCGCNETGERSHSESQAPTIHYTSIVHDHIQSFEIDALLGQLDILLNKLAVEQCSIVLFDSPHPASSFEPAIPKNLQTIFVREKNKRLDDIQNNHGLEKTNLTAALFSGKSTATMTIKPLLFDEALLGYMVLDTNDDDNFVLELLRSHLSVCLAACIRSN